MVQGWRFICPFVASIALVRPACADDTAAALSGLENSWAHIRYELKDNREKLEAARALAVTSKSLKDQHPGAADVMAWHAFVLLLEAEIRHDISALGIAKEAKQLLEEADKIDTKALDGTIHTALGALYDQVPGWPVGFGDNRKANEHFSKALAIAPSGMESNFFYGDYLLEHGKVREAMPYLEKAMAAPVRPDHARADAGRRTEIAEDLAEAEKKLKK